MNSMDISMCIRKLAAGPISQLSFEAKTALTALAENPTADGMKSILDDCAAYGWASDFCMVVMDLLWKELLKNDP